MRISTHGDYLVQLTQLPNLFPINCYLVRESDGFTMVDTGFNVASSIVAAAQGLGLPIQRIILTHAHADHVGSLDRLHQMLPAAEVMISARDARFLAGAIRLDPDEPPAKLRGSYQTTTTRPTRQLVDGERVGSLQVVSSPGHTPGHIALFDRRDRTLIAGDAFQTRAGLAVAGTLQWLFPFPALATWHRPSALASAQRLRALEPVRLAVGHGEVLEEPLPAMDRALAITAQQIGEVVYHGA